MVKQFFILFFLIPLVCGGQNLISSKEIKKSIAQKEAMSFKGSFAKAKVIDGETIPEMNLQPVVFCADRVFKNKRQAREWTRLKYHVKKVYPYAILASAKLKEYDRILATIPTEAARKKYTKQVEEELKNQFGEELKNLTMTQGRILLKLIDRETGKTSYTIVKEMRGSFSAFMWQSLALLFNSNMKNEYDPAEEDKAIESAIAQIEGGWF